MPLRSGLWGGEGVTASGGRRRAERPCEAALEGKYVQINFAYDVHTAEIGDLQPGTDYFFRVAANNAQVRSCARISAGRWDGRGRN